MKPNAPRIVIAPYKVPKKNQEAFIKLLVRKRNYYLKHGYVTTRMPILMRSNKNPKILIDIFEWMSSVTELQAHRDTNVRKIWRKMEALWSDGGMFLETLPEAHLPFPEFEPLNIYSK